MAEILFTHSGDGAEDRRIRRLAKSGQLRQIVPRVYSTNLRDRPEAITHRNIWTILGRLLPGAVISARSAALAAPAYHPVVADQPRSPGYVFLTGSSRRALSLPGIEVRLAAGPGARAQRGCWRC
jgi:hypothetical protein